MPARKIDLDELRRLHAEGWHRDELAAHFDVDPNVITTTRRSLGLPLDPPRRSPLAGRRPKVDREELARLLEEGWTNAEIARHFDVSGATVTRARRALGVPTHFLAPEKVARIEEALEDGWSFAEISRTLDVDPETLRRRWPGRSWTKAERIEHTRGLRWFWEDVAKANYVSSLRDLRKASLAA